MTDFADLPLMIEPSQLASRLNAPGVILVHLSSPERYAAGHIPGAYWVEPKRTQLGQPPAPGLLPEKSQLEQLFSELGHQPDATYVVYDDEGGGWAGRFIWILDVIGHSRYHVLNGGLQAWLADVGTLSSDVPAAAQQPVSLHLQDGPSASLDYILSRLGADDLVIWDARSPGEYSGEKAQAQKAGHIPGAVNFEWTAGMDPERDMRIRLDLQEQLNALGITPDKEIITHCQTHRRSGFTYLAAKVLGYPRVKAYPGSWAEWGNHPDTPVER